MTDEQPNPVTACLLELAKHGKVAVQHVENTTHVEIELRKRIAPDQFDRFIFLRSDREHNSVEVQHYVLEKLLLKMLDEVRIKVSPEVKHD